MRPLYHGRAAGRPIPVLGGRGLGALTLLVIVLGLAAIRRGPAWAFP